jgi:hypothetical protein
VRGRGEGEILESNTSGEIVSITKQGAVHSDRPERLHLRGSSSLIFTRADFTALELRWLDGLLPALGD